MTCVIPSANARNLNLCIQALLDTHPHFDLQKIICVDDGAQAGCNFPIRFVPGIKPFVYARNSNLGWEAAGDDDVLLLGDDVEFCTPQGMELLQSHGTLASPMVFGSIGNPRQGESACGLVVEEPESLCFVCVYLPRKLLQSVGRLDERFVGYGYEDTDYSVRALEKGWKLIIDGRVRVNHDVVQNSSYRRKTDYGLLFSQNRFLFDEKWPGHKPLGGELDSPGFF